MKKILCPICKKYMSEHDRKQTISCLDKFINVMTNPVVYGSSFGVGNRICPTCNKDVNDHNTIQIKECVEKFVKEVLASTTK
jgi:hypothetical protein